MCQTLRSTSSGKHSEVDPINTIASETPANTSGRIDLFLAGLGTLRVAMVTAMAALAVRWLWLLMRSTPLDGDEEGYLSLAENLARHFRFAYGPSMPLEAHFGPVYTALQASLITLGLTPAWAGWTVSSLAGSVTAGIVYVIGIRLWKKPTAAVTAAAMAVVNPAMVSASTHIYPEALSSLFLVLVVMCLMGERRVGMFSGIFLGLAALTRREAIVLVPFAVVYVLAVGSGTFQANPRRWRVREAVLLFAGTAFLFAPYLFYLRAVTGHWTISNNTNFSWALGRLMEKRPGEGVSFEEIRKFESRYPSPVAYIRAEPGECAAGLAGSTWAHLRWAFMGGLAWPIGVIALAGLGSAILRRRPLPWPPSPIFLPFVLVLAWSYAGPVERYSQALGPFVCLIAGGVMVGDSVKR